MRCCAEEVKARGAEVVDRTCALLRRLRRVQVQKDASFFSCSPFRALRFILAFLRISLHYPPPQVFIITDNPALADGLDPNPLVIPRNGPLTALTGVLPLQVIHI